MDNRSGSSLITATLRLLATKGIGPKRYYELLYEFKSPVAALEALPNIAQGKFQPPTSDWADDILARHQKADITILHHQMMDYPVALAACADAPPLLFCRGNPLLLSRSSVAIVGARNASLQGRKWTEKISQQLGAEGYVVVSGMARGIDTAAHQGSLITGTVAVLAGGVDYIYPPENAELYHQIAAQGCLVSEDFLGTKPQARHFPKRNRIVAGLTLGTLVVEASQKSGSLITTRLALDYGREVFAMPGHPHDPRAAGPNYLIKTQQAQLVTEAKDVLNAITDMTTEQLISHTQEQQSTPQYLIDTLFTADNDIIDTPISDIESENIYTQLLSAIGQNSIEVDTLIRSLPYPTAQLLTALTELELDGKLERQAGGFVRAI